MKVNMKTDNSIALDRYAWNIGQNKAYIRFKTSMFPTDPALGQVSPSSSLPGLFYTGIIRMASVTCLVGVMLY